MNAMQKIQSEARKFYLDKKELPKGILIGYRLACDLQWYFQENEIKENTINLFIENCPIYKTPDHNIDIIIF